MIYVRRNAEGSQRAAAPHTSYRSASTVPVKSTWAAITAKVSIPTRSRHFTGNRRQEGRQGVQNRKKSLAVCVSIRGAHALSSRRPAGHVRCWCREKLFGAVNAARSIAHRFRNLCCEWKKGLFVHNYSSIEHDRSPAPVAYERLSYYSQYSIRTSFPAWSLDAPVVRERSAVQRLEPHPTP